jgi:GxxExxY protein
LREISQILMEQKDFKYPDITEKNIGAAMKLHSHFGLGFPEVVYKRALIIELQILGLQCNTETEKEIIYQNKLIAKRRLDLIVENKVLVELKALSEIDKRCHNQIINYLNIFSFEVGLLLNFGRDSLEFKRFANSKGKSAKSI